jgi:4-oxalocrotonate tautomerase
MLNGRTLEQKRALVEQLTEVVCKTIDTKPENVSIIINEMDREDYARNGQLYVDKPVNK